MSDDVLPRPAFTFVAVSVGPLRSTRKTSLSSPVVVPEVGSVSQRNATNRLSGEMTKSFWVEEAPRSVSAAGVTCTGDAVIGPAVWYGAT